MVPGEKMSTSPRNQGVLGSTHNGSPPNDSIATIDSLPAQSDPPSNHLRVDVHTDDDLARIVIGRRIHFVPAEYPTWTDAITRVALGASLMSKTRGITTQEQVRLMHLSHGSNYIRLHEFQTYLFGNGSFRLFNGVFPESTLQRRMEFASRAECFLWSIEQ